MPQMASSKSFYKEETMSNHDDEDSSGSDFDDDDDPDKIEVPGGGRNLATAAGLKDPNMFNKMHAAPPPSQQPASHKLPADSHHNPFKALEGLVTKGNSQPGFEFVQGNAMGSPFAAPSSAGLLGAMGGMNMFPPGFNAAQILQQMEMVSMGMGMNMGGMNPYFMQLLQQASMPMGGGGLKQWGGQPLAAKSVANMWLAHHDPSKLAAPPEEEEVEDEELGVAETYADYMPSKLKLGKKHPDPVVETASLSSVPPADVWYTVSLPHDTMESGALSALQLESITYASQQHEHILPDGSRAGFLIGDGAGVGKGRTIAGIIFENYLKGRKRAIWISVSNDLRFDAERDLQDIGAGKLAVHPLNKFKYAKISSATNGNVKKGVIFSTYSALIGESNSTQGKYKSRLKQLLQWCGEDFDGPIIFDECHRAKNLCPVGSSKPTKTGLTVLELQNKLPKARVVYASATGASEPRNMAYMVRLGMWGDGTPFPDFADFISAVEKRGIGAMEIVAMDMKLRGMYIARQLSFHGVTFRVEKVPLTKGFIEVYDHSVALWVEAMHKFQEAAELVDAESRMKKTMWGQFWSSHQRFFKYLCIAAKVNHAVVTAREAVKCGKCVVIGLQSTGEARTLEQLERDDGELNDFVSTAKGVLQSLVEKHFPAPDRARIHRLLGIDRRPANGDAEELLAAAAGSSSSSAKRKPVRQAAARAIKRSRRSTSDSDASNSDSSASEFKLSDNSDPSEEEDEDDSDAAADEERFGYSDASSDFNPFDSGSDSDADPWVGGRKKKQSQPPARKKKKKPAAGSAATAAIKALLKKTNGSQQQQQQHHHHHQQQQQQQQLQAPPKDAIERACSMKEELLAKIERLGDRLPPNTLDQLIDELGGADSVAEMTGRKGRVVQTEDGIQYESRSEVDVSLELLNITEKQRFMDGERYVAIISEAASSGISLQSDRRAKNQRRRVHITLELPWSADRAIQQFGRTHRSNQVNAPEYIFLISDLAGEQRFASIVAKRLESLGALTHGDRRATETRDLSQFNIDNKYGRAALEATMKTIMQYEQPLVPPPQDYAGDFFKDIADALVGVGLIVNSESMPGILSLDKDYNNMSKFLNRILGMPVDLQNRLFHYFTDTLNAIIGQAKKLGKFDLGILDLGTAGENVRRVRLYTFLRKHATGTAPTELHTVQVERGMSWEQAQDKWAELTGGKEGFYLSHQVRNGKQTAVLAVAVDHPPSGKKKLSSSSGGAGSGDMYQIYRPNTGLQFRQESLAELEKKYKKASCDEARPAWQQQYSASATTCSHAYWQGNCRHASAGGECEVGLRRRSYNVVAGSVLSVWSRVENVLAARAAHNHKMQVVRLRTEDGLKIVGTLVPKTCVEALIEALSSDAEKVNQQTF